jgi:polyphosphate kinase
MAKTVQDPQEDFLNRELSWLEFNQRVIEQGREEMVPLMERLKFLAIASSNLDEFFMVRVAALKHQQAARPETADISGLTPTEQLEKISDRVRRMISDQTDAVCATLKALGRRGLSVKCIDELTAEQMASLDAYFANEVLPLLTPMAADKLDPFPLLPGLGLNLVFYLKPAGADATGEEETGIAVVPVPRNLNRFVRIPSSEGAALVSLEQVIQSKAGTLFPKRVIEAAATFRLTRDSDVDVPQEEAEDFLSAVERAVKSRKRRSVLRLELSSNPHLSIKDWLVRWCEIPGQDIYEIEGLIDATGLAEIAGTSGFSDLRDPEWPPQQPMDLIDSEDIWETLRERDVLLIHPYESFEPVIQLLQEASADPDVLAIKQTLYRTSRDSPVIEALARAAENGKQVTVLLELKARFDEVQNVQWARRLEDAGCHVIYGIAGYKTHSKVLLIVRREPHGIRRYMHMATGNYNEHTAKLYSDIGLMTTDTDLAMDAAAFFNLLTGYSEEVGWNRLSVAPTGLKAKILDLIEREIGASTEGRPGLIMAKLNAIQHETVCRALYKASQAGVRVKLNVRGICCVRPGVTGISENIEVTSIVDRYLEHARIFYFYNGGREEVYLSSADWMSRNLDHRLETMFPVTDPALRARLKSALDIYFADNVKAWRLRQDGSYERVTGKGPRLRAQEKLFDDAVHAAAGGGAASTRFRPLVSPDEERKRGL